MTSDRNENTVMGKAHIAGFTVLCESSINKKPILPPFEHSLKFKSGVINSTIPFITVGDYTILISGMILDVKDENYHLSDYEKKSEELIGELYRQYGEECYAKLDGHFLIILFDRRVAITHFFQRESELIYVFSHRAEIVGLRS